MTRVMLKKGRGHCTIICRGHAEGSPEMCAAVSCLVYSAAGWLRNTTGAQILDERLEPGDAYISFTGFGAKWLYDFLAVGFLQLEQHDPEHIAVEAE